MVKKKETEDCKKDPKGSRKITSSEKPRDLKGNKVKNMKSCSEILCNGNSLMTNNNERPRLYLDSGANSHTAIDKNYFVDLNEMESSTWNPKIAEFDELR